MKKAKPELNDWARPEYTRSDLDKPVRGKYAARLQKASNVVVLDPEVAEVFPNAEAVNTALKGLISNQRKTRKLARKKPASKKSHAA